MTLNITRVWAMPDRETFSMQPIGDLVKRYLRESKISVDPFERNKRWATYTNDLNPQTEAEYHMDALDFLRMLREKLGEQGADLVIFDPPYSPTQIKRVYDSIGLNVGEEEAWRTHGWKKERDVINELLNIGGIVISCGWNSQGMGEGRAYEKEELLITCCGAGHNDILTLVERKLVHQPRLME